MMLRILTLLIISIIISLMNNCVRGVATYLRMPPQIFCLCANVCVAMNVLPLNREILSALCVLCPPQLFLSWHLQGGSEKIVDAHEMTVVISSFKGCFLLDCVSNWFFYDAVCRRCLGSFCRICFHFLLYTWRYLKCSWTHLLLLSLLQIIILKYS